MQTVTSPSETNVVKKTTTSNSSLPHTYTLHHEIPTQSTFREEHAMKEKNYNKHKIKSVALQSPFGVVKFWSATFGGKKGSK